MDSSVFFFFFAPQFKKDIEAERAGIQFVPYQQLQAAVCKDSTSGLSPVASDTSAPAPVPSGTASSLEGGGIEQERQEEGEEAQAESERDREGEREGRERERGRETGPGSD